MLASIDHKFVLLCNPKSASSSLTKAYRKFANFDVGRGSDWKHLSWTEHRNIFGSFFDDAGCETFAVIRTPDELLVSWWKFRQRDKIQNPAHPHHQNSTVGIGFETFVREWASPEPKPWARIIEQADVLGDGAGSPAPIRFFRYEDLPLLVAELNERIGEEVEIPVANRSPKLDGAQIEPWMRELPRYQSHLEFYEQCVERGQA